MVNPQAIVARERSALTVHQASLRSGQLPAPKSAPRGTFVHGLLLPASIFVATLRSPTLRGPFLRLTAVRGAVLVAVAVLVLVPESSSFAPHRPRVNVQSHGDQDEDPPVKVNVDLPGAHIHLDETMEQADVSFLGQQALRTQGDGSVAQPSPAQPPPSRLGQIRERLHQNWKQVLEIVGGLSALEGVIVFFSRRWDDWLSFYISGLAGIRPEAPEPPLCKLAFDLSWIGRKLKKRIRGYVIFGSGMPLLYLLRLVPVAGPWLFGAATTLWAWYWMGVFTAAKSGHAWVDDGIAPPPLLVRVFNARFATGWWWGPLRLYGRVWAWLVRGVSSAAAAFDRNPASFLGLALARAVLSLPGLYLLARPIVPVAAGRLCAESDPGDRFTMAPSASLDR
jgi:hypothetical protein